MATSSCFIRSTKACAASRGRSSPSTCFVSRAEKSSNIGADKTPRLAPNPSGHTQVDGPTAVVDRDRTEANRTLVRAFKQIVTVELRFDRVDEFIDGDHYTQHASKVGDGVARMKSRVSEVAKPGVAPVLMPRRYVAEGNFVLALVEARTEPPTANYDLFRVQNGKIAEHWDVLSPIPPRNEWKNANGPF